MQQEGEIVFVGVYERSVDDNGRLALPAPFRGELGDRCYATLDPQGCVTVRTSATFESEAAEMIDAVKDGRASSAQRRNLATSTIAVSVDKQDLSPHLRPPPSCSKWQGVHRSLLQFRSISEHSVPGRLQNSAEGCHSCR